MEQYDEFKNFRRYRQVADELIAHSMPEELAECAKLLALNVAHYQSKYGCPAHRRAAREPRRRRARSGSDQADVGGDADAGGHSRLRAQHGRSKQAALSTRAAARCALSRRDLSVRQSQGARHDIETLWASGNRDLDRALLCRLACSGKRRCSAARFLQATIRRRRTQRDG
jgi:hypothetical protein